MEIYFLSLFVRRRQYARAVFSFLLGSLLFATILMIIPKKSPSSEINYSVSNINVSKEELRRILKDGEIENGERLRRIQEVCQKYNLGLYKTSDFVSKFKYPPTPQYSVFYFHRAERLAYCPLYKAASTTWLYNLSILGGSSHKELDERKEQLSVVARRHFPELDGSAGEEALLDSRRLLSVRHPFERILSAFRDKLENRNRDPASGTLHYYKKWGSKIRGKFRETGQLEPTFQEFVRYLIQTDLLNYADDHWIPYNLYCTPCLVRYDYITKVETLKRDQMFVIYSLGLADRVTPVQKNTIGRPDQVASNYFGQITQQQLQALYKKYQLDFEMFNYSPQMYLTMAKP